MSATLDRLAAARVVAVLRAERGGEVAPAVEALRAGGIRAVEVTWTSPEPAAELAGLRAAYGDELVLGAGTLRTPDDVDEAVAAGADFVVSPHLEPRLLEAMLASGRLALPGTLTPTEVAAALDAGAEAVKLFPSSLGGVGHLRALRGPFPELRAVPTGGVDADNVGEWLAAGAVAVGAAGALCPRALIEAGRWDELSDLAARFAAAGAR